jgi:hypothetical protein
MPLTPAARILVVKLSLTKVMTQGVIVVIRITTALVWMRWVGVAALHSRKK